MGKKGKANKLAKMSEEERARYLQQRADIEEEARRRKMHLIALYMKNKLKREDAFCRLNMAKINQNWRSILREIKCDELRKEIVELEKHCKERIERKDQTIARLLSDLDNAEDSYATLQTTNMEIIRKLLELHAQRSDFFKKSHETEKSIMTKECEDDIKAFKKLSDQAQEELECVVYQLEDMTEKQLKENHEEHLEKVDDLKATTQLHLEEITRTRETQLECLWQEYQDVLNGYVQRTEGFYSEYIDLKERDEENTATMVAHCREIELLNEKLENLKSIDAENTADNEFKINHLTNMRNDLAKQLAERKQEVAKQIHEEEERLKLVSVESYTTIKALQKIEKQGESLLQLSEICRKYETEREKFMLSGLPPIKREMFAQTEESTKEPPADLKDITLGTWQKMEGFWKRVNNVTVDVMCLEQEKSCLKAENERLKREIQEHLADLNIANGSNAHINDYLAKRPNSMRVNRVQPLELEEKQKCSSAVTGVRRRTQRPFTAVTEANFTNAVRSKVLSLAKPKLPKIDTIVHR